MSDRLEDAKAFGAAIHQARKAQGLKQAELAGLCNTGLRFISDLENGKTSCQLGLALMVAKNLGLKLRVEGPRG
ncbi:MAG TPA: helix-turn-helix domain-containing protein [bacterium]|nr:helix-turn-helix domain-containing protein [bacterium]